MASTVNSGFVILFTIKDWNGVNKFYSPIDLSAVFKYFNGLSVYEIYTFSPPFAKKSKILLEKTFWRLNKDYETSFLNPGSSLGGCSNLEIEKLPLLK